MPDDDDQRPRAKHPVGGIMNFASTSLARMAAELRGAPTGKRPYRAWLTLLGLTLVLGGCNTTPERPTLPPAPRPISESEPPPPPPALPESHPETPTEGNAAAAARYPAPSADAADVEVEEVPLDGSERKPARPQTEVLAEMGEPRTRGADSAGGGGAPVPAGGSMSAGTETAGATGQSISGGPRADPNLSAPNIQLGAQTHDEQVAALDRELSVKLAKFDELMSKARAAAEAERAAGSGSPQGELDGHGQRTERPPDGGGAGGAGAVGSGLGNTPDLVGQSGGVARPSPLAAATPADIPDGRDDDIVARQLREAATNEKDPVLRDKLWAEYRKYKAGL